MTLKKSVENAPRPHSFLQTGAGQGLLWCLPPSRKSVGRSGKLFTVAAKRGTTDFFAEKPRWREVTLLETARCPSQELERLLARLREGAAGGVIRLEIAAEDLTQPPPAVEWAGILSRAAPAFVHLVLNHPTGLTAPALAWLAQLGRQGIPLVSETFLEGGINDRGAVLRELFLALLKSGVRPYYLIEAAWVPLARRVAPGAGLELIRELRGWISGLAVPQLVRENREGVREVLIPSYVTRLDEGGAEGVNYRGRRFSYPHLPPESG